MVLPSAWHATGTSQSFAGCAWGRRGAMSLASRQTSLPGSPNEGGGCVDIPGRVVFVTGTPVRKQLSRCALALTAPVGSSRQPMRGWPRGSCQSGQPHAGLQRPGRWAIRHTGVRRPAGARPAWTVDRPESIIAGDDHGVNPPLSAAVLTLRSRLLSAPRGRLASWCGCPTSAASLLPGRYCG